jgi:hypothetical protein
MSTVKDTMVLHGVRLDEGTEEDGVEVREESKRHHQNLIKTNHRKSRSRDNARTMFIRSLIAV